MTRLLTHCTSGGRAMMLLAQFTCRLFQFLGRHQMIEDSPLIGTLSIFSSPV